MKRLYFKPDEMSAHFQTTFIQNLEFGHNLKICAKANRDASWFLISLTTERCNDAIIDIGLHMLVYINQNCMTFQQCLNNCWKQVKNVSFATNVFLTQFRINIIMETDCFQIAINDADAESYISVNYGMSLSRLNTLRISGHLKYIKQVDHRKYFPPQWPPIQVYEDRIDFSNEQPVSFNPGQILVIKAQLKGNPKGRFVIHFRNAWNVKRQELHLSVRFDTKQFVRNSKIPLADQENSEFGVEEIDGDFPFDDFRKPFTLAIAFTASKFRIAKDGQFICDYNYRTENVLKDIVGVKIFGINGVNVRVSRINYILSNDPHCLSFVNYSQ